MTTTKRSAKALYLDASALVKLVVDEGDHGRIRTFFDKNTGFATLTPCLTETLGVIKAKWTHGRLTETQYFAATKRLISYAWEERIEVEDSINLFAPDAQEAVEAVARRHGLDLADALQIVAILRGRYSRLTADSASVLITADRKLGQVATNEGIRVWICIDGDPPDWA